MTKDGSRLDSVWDKACAMVVSSPEILSGTPVIRGTRVPVHDVGTWAQQGVPTTEILTHYPALSEEQVELSRLYVEAFPAPPPTRRRDLPEGTTVLVKKVMPL